MDEPVDPGGVGPQVGAKQGVGAAVGEHVGDFGVRPVGNAVPGVVGALADAGSGVERDVQGRAYKLGVMVDADSGGELLVIGGREQRQGLAESFEQHLLGCVHGKEPDPGNGPGGAALRVTGSLEAVAEDFVQGELPGLDLGEAGLPQVQAQADVPAAAVGPVGPVGVDRGGLDAQGIRRRGPGELPDLRLVFARGVPDGIVRQSPLCTAGCGHLGQATGTRVAETKAVRSSQLGRYRLSWRRRLLTAPRHASEMIILPKSWTG